MMNRIWYSKKYHVNFLGIPKTGVTSVCKALDIDIDGDWSEVSVFTSMVQRSPLIENDYPTFTILRHPVARLMSGRQECMRRGTWSQLKELKEAPKLNTTKVYERMLTEDAKGNTFEVLEFSDFVDTIEQLGFFDEHIEPMSKYFIPELVDKVFIFEDDGFEKMLRWACKLDETDEIIFGLKQNASQPYEKTLSLETLLKIEYLYKEDFELYRKHGKEN